MRDERSFFCLTLSAPTSANNRGTVSFGANDATGDVLELCVMLSFKKKQQHLRQATCLFPVLFFSPTLRHLKPFYFFFLHAVTRATRLNSCRGEQKVPLSRWEASVVSGRKKQTNKQRADYAHSFMNERLLLLHARESDVHTSVLACVLCRTERRHSVLMPPSSYRPVLYTRCVDMCAKNFFN